MPQGSDQNLLDSQTFSISDLAREFDITPHDPFLEDQGLLFPRREGRTVFSASRPYPSQNWRCVASVGTVIGADSGNDLDMTRRAMKRRSS